MAHHILLKKKQQNPFPVWSVALQNGENKKGCTVCIRRGGICHFHKNKSRFQSEVECEPAFPLQEFQLDTFDIKQGGGHQQQAIDVEKEQSCTMCLRLGTCCSHHQWQEMKLSSSLSSSEETTDELEEGPCRMCLRRGDLCLTHEMKREREFALERLCLRDVLPQKAFGWTHKKKPCKICIYKGDFCRLHEHQRGSVFVPLSPDEEPQDDWQIVVDDIEQVVDTSVDRSCRETEVFDSDTDKHSDDTPTICTVEFFETEEESTEEESTAKESIDLFQDQDKQISSFCQTTKMDDESVTVCSSVTSEETVNQASKLFDVSNNNKTDQGQSDCSVTSHETDEESEIQDPESVAVCSSVSSEEIADDSKPQDQVSQQSKLFDVSSINKTDQGQSDCSVTSHETEEESDIQDQESVAVCSSVSSEEIADDSKPQDQVSQQCKLFDVSSNNNTDQGQSDCSVTSHEIDEVSDIQDQDQDQDQESEASHYHKVSIKADEDAIVDYNITSIEVKDDSHGTQGRESPVPNLSCITDNIPHDFFCETLDYSYEESITNGQDSQVSGFSCIGEMTDEKSCSVTSEEGNRDSKSAQSEGSQSSDVSGIINQAVEKPTNGTAVSNETMDGREGIDVVCITSVVSNEPEEWQRDASVGGLLSTTENDANIVVSSLSETILEKGKTESDDSGCSSEQEHVPNNEDQPIEHEFDVSPMGEDNSSMSGEGAEQYSMSVQLVVQSFDVCSDILNKLDQTKNDCLVVSSESGKKLGVRNRATLLAYGVCSISEGEGSLADFSFSPNKALQTATQLRRKIGSASESLSLLWLLISLPVLFYITLPELVDEITKAVYKKVRSALLLKYR